VWTDACATWDLGSAQDESESEAGAEDDLAEVGGLSSSSIVVSSWSLNAYMAPQVADPQVHLNAARDELIGLNRAAEGKRQEAAQLRLQAKELRTQADDVSARADDLDRMATLDDVAICNKQHLIAMLEAAASYFEAAKADAEAANARAAEAAMVVENLAASVAAAVSVMKRTRSPTLDGEQRASQAPRTGAGDGAGAGAARSSAGRPQRSTPRTS
jgi:predicted  nucleic acid-binding Zn-ribbon protein